ncbi:MAG: T9SS C-terminal target domain-containing protein, partial [Chitinophagia bacterium]|nr:T9SS C-terminal target domain-containing protein [Chitinophagia bacterium]
PNGSFTIGASTASSDGDLVHAHAAVDGWIFNIDDTGHINWQQNCSTSQSQMLTGLVALPAGGYGLCGYKYTGDLWTGATDSMGNLVWERTYGGSGADYGWAVAAAPGGGMVTAGVTESHDREVTGFNGGTNDAWVLKVAGTAAVADPLRQTPTVYVYPVPTAGTVYLYGLTSPVVAVAINALGQVVARLPLSPSQAEISVTDWPSGIYYLRWVAADGSPVTLRLQKE